LDLRVHPSECNNEYCIGLTLVRFVTAMVLHSFCLSCVCKLILTHTWDAFGFPCKIRCDSLRGCIYAFWESWGVLNLALHEILLGREANLVSINSVSSRFSWFAALPCWHNISHVRTPNNANSVSRLCATKLAPTLVFIVFLRNEDKIPQNSLRR
jgi:hypothetical protein